MSPLFDRTRKHHVRGPGSGSGTRTRTVLLALIGALCLAVTGVVPASAVDVDTDRIAGPDRYATAVAASQQYFNAEDTYDVYVASALDYPDALAAGPPAASDGAPLLLVPPRGLLPRVVRDELNRLQPISITIIGGTSAVNSQIEGQLRDYAEYLWRWAGSNRYETAVEAAWAGSVPLEGGTVFIASGQGFADALGGGAAASRVNGVLLLTRPDRLPEATREHLEFRGPGEVIILGGRSAVSGKVQRQIRNAAPGATITRRAGADRYATAAAASRYAFPGSAETVHLASGSTFPDALAGGPAATRVGRSPLLLTKRDCVPASTRQEIRRLGATRVVALGGASVVSDRALQLTPC